MVVMSENWVPEDKELVVKIFELIVARAYHRVMKTIQVDSEAINRAFKA